MKKIIGLIMFGFIALFSQVSFAAEAKEDKADKSICEITAEKATIQEVNTEAIVFVVTERFAVLFHKGESKPTLAVNEAILSIGDHQIRQSKLIPRRGYLNRRT